MNGDEQMISLSQVSAVGAKAEALREHLRNCFLKDAPRAESTIFESLMQLLDIFLKPVVPECPPNPVGCSVSYLIEQYYLQEVFAALLLLAGDITLDGVVVVLDSVPQRVATEVPQSAFYVDIHTRRYCLELLLYLCFSRFCKTQSVVRALYPLLVDGATKQAGEVLQNHISGDLFASSRFQSRKKLVSSVLNGIVLSLPDGVRATIGALLLNDSVSDCMSRQAANHIASIFTSTLTPAWLCDDRGEHLHRQSRDGRNLIVVYCNNVTLERQSLALSSQLLSIAVCHASDSPTTREAPRLPAFLQRRRGMEEDVFLKHETLEERLHLCLATILNALSQLPLRSENERLFKRCYKRFYLYNKYFFTPAFRVLSMNTAVDTPDASINSAGVSGATSHKKGVLNNVTDEMLTALQRLGALAKGSTLGPASHALLLVLPPVVPGLLELIVVEDALPPAHRTALGHLTSALWKLEGKFKEIARILVHGALNAAKGSVTIDRVTGAVGVELCPTSPKARRIRGLHRLLVRGSTPSALCCNVLLAVAEECQKRAAMGNGMPDELTNCKPAGAEVSSIVQSHGWSCARLFRPTPVRFLCDGENGGTEFPYVEGVEGNEENMLAHMVESVCLDMSADAVFGANVTLDHVCDVLAIVSTISFACWRWAVLLIPKVFSKDIVSAVLAQHVTAAGRRKVAHDLLLRGERLASVVNALHAAVVGSAVDGDAKEAEEALQAAVEMARESCGDEGGECEGKQNNVSCGGNDVALAYSRLSVEIEKCLETRSISSLVVHLLALSRMAEDASRKGRNIVHTVVEEMMRIVQAALMLLVRVLGEVDDACGAVAAVKTMVWWALERADSPDSSFIAKLLIKELTRDVCKASSKGLSPTPVPLTPAHVDRMKVRLLDVLLGLCDYDEEGRTLRNMDDYCWKVWGYSLYDVIRDLCGPTHSVVVQVAALHLVGYFTVAVAPRVSLVSVCGLCSDVFRHTPHAMAKAAGAAMLVNICSSVEVFGEVDIQPLLRVAESMRTYRDDTLNNAEHEEVIRRHGRCIKDLLQQKQLTLLVQEMRDC